MTTLENCPIKDVVPVLMVINSIPYTRYIQLENPAVGGTGIEGEEGDFCGGLVKRAGGKRGLEMVFKGGSENVLCKRYPNLQYCQTVLIVIKAIQCPNPSAEIKHPQANVCLDRVRVLLMKLELRCSLFFFLFDSKGADPVAMVFIH